MKPNPEWVGRGGRLKRARKTAGISQGELAEATQRKQEMISRFETGRYDIEADIIVYLHEKHQINPLYILQGLYPIRTEERLIRKPQPHAEALHHRQEH